MDVSPVSSAKTDFSIERILSAESSSGEAESPSWLCCTRYRPPRLPRAVNSNVCRPRRSGRHARVPFTGAQAAALEAAYARAPYLAPPALRALAAALQLRDDRIKIWFQNRRARERREKCIAITPPQAITLPATPISWTPANAPRTEDVFIRSVRVNSLEAEAREFCEEIGIEARPESPLDVETVDE